MSKVQLNTDNKTNLMNKHEGIRNDAILKNYQLHIKQNLWKKISEKHTTQHTRCHQLPLNIPNPLDTTLH